MEKIVIIGDGPAGISAALYAARGNMEPLVISMGSSALDSELLWPVKVHDRERTS